MIFTRSPLRLSFAGGGTDFKDFYTKYPGRVISASIDKYVYVVINKTPLIDKITAKYSITESVNKPDEIQNTRIREALKFTGVEGGIEIATFADLPTRTGLGSSSSFSVALLQAIYTMQKKNKTVQEIAEDACNLEVNLCKEPIGKQDQYAAATGGFNIFFFSKNESVQKYPVFKNSDFLQKHLVLFFTGITRDAKSVLIEHKKNIEDKTDTLREMSDGVPAFMNFIVDGDMEAAGLLMRKHWEKKKSLASNVSNPILDILYGVGINSGAWGGKVVGAGNGGCILFMAPPEKQNEIIYQMKCQARSLNLEGFKHIPFQLENSGVQTLYNNE